MAVRGFFIISLLALIMPCTLGTDYCNQSETLCPANFTHVDCLPSKFGEDCRGNANLYVFPVLSPLRIALLNRVNSIRNTVAGGLYTGADGEYLPKASRMVYMEWDDKLASMAEKIALSCCNTSGSMCYNTPIYPLAGILSHSLTLLKGTMDPIDIINETISTWEEGSAATSSSDVESYKANRGNSDFATLITDRNARIGCSMVDSEEKDESYSTFYLVCILSTRSIDGCPIYTQAKESRCGCTYYSESHPYLCAGGDFDSPDCPDKQFCEHQAAILCPSGTTHVACVDSPRNCETISLGGQEIETILQKINSYRDQTASGGVVDSNNENFPTASRTAATTWSRDLSNLAALHAATCPTSKDECHNSKTFNNSGQSIYAASAEPLDISEKFDLAVDFWFDQHSSMEPSVVDNYVSNSKFEDFAQLVNERNVKVGCSVSYDNHNSVMYVVCNFAVTNTEGCQVYSGGRTPASACNTTSPVYSSLCESTEYNYYVNQAVQYNTDQCV